MVNRRGNDFLFTVSIYVSDAAEMAIGIGGMLDVSHYCTARPCVFLRCVFRTVKRVWCTVFSIAYALFHCGHAGVSHF